jgi:biotin synthase
MNLNTVLSKDDLSKEEIVYLLSLSEKKDIEKLFANADAVRNKYCGDGVHLRGIIEFSNYCEQDCLYCGLRISNRELPRYRMTKEEILQTASKICETGIKTIVLQSGEDHFYSKSLITDLIISIKEKYDTAITLSIGERGRDEYDEWKDAGADRYLLKHETANNKLYSAFHKKEKLKSRLAHIQYLKSIGFQTGSGNIISLPNQALEDIADDIFLCKELDVDMASFSPFIPSPATPLKKAPKADLGLTLKTIAVARIALKNVHIPATTALGTLDVLGREKGLQVGANVIMPNFTPSPYRQHYQIYPDKKCIGDDPLACGSCLKQMIQALGRTIAEDKGDSLKLSAVN